MTTTIAARTWSPRPMCSSVSPEAGYRGDCFASSGQGLSGTGSNARSIQSQGRWPSQLERIQKDPSRLAPEAERETVGPTPHGWQVRHAPLRQIGANHYSLQHSNPVTPPSTECAPDADDLLYAEELSQLDVFAVSEGPEPSSAPSVSYPQRQPPRRRDEHEQQRACLHRLLASQNRRIVAHAPAEEEHSSLAAALTARKQEVEDKEDAKLGSSACVHEKEEKHGSEEEEEESALSRAYLVSYFVAGGAAGAASRTVVSPLERLKIIMQIQPHEKPSSAGGGSAAIPSKAARASGGSKGAYAGVWSGLVKMWREEGMAGFMRGNGINCLRIAPYSAVQFSSYEVLKNLFLRSHYVDGHGHGHGHGHGQNAGNGGGHAHDISELAVWERLTAGALAGIASVVSTYPLDLVRSRISIASASLYSEAKAAEQGRLSAATGASSTSASTLSAGNKLLGSAPSVAAGARSVTHTTTVVAATGQKRREELRAKQKRVPGIWAMTLKVYREEGGVRGLYRGCVPTSAGVAPYVSLNFIGYETLRERFEDDEGRISDLSKLGCGAAAGSVSQTLTYPLDVLRRRLQVAGMRDSQLGYSDTTSFGVFRTIVRQDGVRGLYRGLWPNLLKVAPSIGVSFWTYETVRSWLEPHHHHATGHH